MSFFSFIHAAKSQTKASIKGIITSKENIGVIATSVSLLKADSSLVMTGLTDVDGKFNLTGINPGDYLLKISNVEYVTYKTLVFMLKADENKIYPTIILKPSNKILNEVVVSTNKPLIEVRPDKIIFNVASSPSASGTNGLDLLKKAPGVKLDLDNNISLLGKDGVQIYINGVPSKLTGTDLAAYLESMTSDNIETLEIISNPGAKYDAEGIGGIINIKTKKNVASGFKGNATSSFTKGIYYKYSNSLTLNYGGEKFKANFIVTQSNNTDLEIFSDNKQLNTNILDLYSHNQQIRKGYNIGFGAEYQINKNQILNFSAQSVLNKSEELLNSNTNIYDKNPQQFKSILISRSDLNAPAQNYNFNLSHNWNINKTANFNTAFSLGTYQTDRSTQQPNSYFQPDGITIIKKDNTSFNANTNINLWSGKIDYDKTFKAFNFSVGAKYAHVKTNNIFDFFNIPNTIKVLDASKSNNFSYDENVLAGYSNINFQVSSKMKLNGGLRVEKTSSRGLLISQFTVNDKDVPRSYFDFFPNLSLNYDIQKNNNFNLSYGRRISRPSYQDLNPFESPNSQLVVWKGNPFLNPNYSTNYQLTYAYKQKLVVSTSYTKTRDYFAKIFEQTGGGATQVIPRNLDRINQYAVSVSYPQTITKFWEIFTMANASRKIFSGNLEGTNINIKATLWDLNIQNNFNLPAGILLNIVYFQQSDWIWRGSVRLKGTHELSFGIRKEFLDKRLQLRLTGNDIFKTTSNYPYFGDYGGIILKGNYIDDERRFGAGITWKFGNQKVKSVKKANGLDDELNRL